MDETNAQSFPNIDLTTHAFTTPQKLINTHDDLSHFLHSKAHALINTFITHLSTSVTPSSASTAATEAYYTDSPAIHVSPTSQSLLDLLTHINSLIDAAPPVEGPRRFGNVAFRTWYSLLKSQSEDLLRTHLPQEIVNAEAKEGGVT